MIHVECESCHAPYDLDERRIPPTGMKMRCPKCGTSFMVSPQTAAGEDVQLPTSKFSKPPSSGLSKSTVMGLGAPTSPPAGKAAPASESPPQDEIDLPGLPFDADLPAPANRDPKGRSLPASINTGTSPKPSAGSPSPRSAFPSDLPAAKKPTQEYEVDLPKPMGSANFAKPKTAQDDIDLPAAKKPAASAGAFGDLDLPTVKRAVPDKVSTPTREADNVDLPAPLRTEADLPAPLRSNVDLPAVKKASVDLPAPKPSQPAAPKGSVAFGDLDLPAVSAAAAAAAGTMVSMQEPSLAPPPRSVPPTRAGVSLDELDFPSLGDSIPPARPSGDVGQKASARASSPPAPKPAEDLPLPDFGSIAPPALSSIPPVLGDGFSDSIPENITLSEPSVAPPPGRNSEISFGDLDLPLPGISPRVAPPAGQAGPDLHQPPRVSFDDLSLPTPRADIAKAKDAPRISFGELDLPSLPGSPPSHKNASPDPHPQPNRGAVSMRPGVGGAGFGELELDASGPGLDISRSQRPSAAIGSEISSLPELPAGAPRGVLEPANIGSQAPERKMRRGVEGTVDPTRVAKKKSAVPYVIAVIVLLLAAGIAAGFLTPYGFFGVYAIQRYLPGAGDDAQIARVIQTVEKRAETDTYPDVRAAVSALAAERRKAGLNEPLLARSLVHESLYLVRFGEDAASSARAAAIYHRLSERGFSAKGSALAQAANALREGKPNEARPFLAKAASEAPRDPYVDLVSGEVSLATGQFVEAAQHFAEAVQKGAGARAQWGTARAHTQAGDDDAAESAVRETLRLSPNHVEARVAAARIALSKNDDETAVRFAKEAAGLVEVNGQRLASARGARAQAFAVLGAVHEKAGRRVEAGRAYEASLELNAVDVEALLGAGRILLQELRYRDALARFESVNAAPRAAAILENGRPASSEAKIGAAQALIALERATDARVMLNDLLRLHPQDPDILTWLGRADEAVEDVAAAELHFREAIRVAPTRFPAYLALSELFFKTNHAEQARELLREAELRVPETAEVRFLRGDALLDRGDLDNSAREFRRALELEPRHLRALFGLGAASRRAHRLEEAASAFERIAQMDPDYPGLATERGLVFEGLGKSEDAVRAYQAALREKPGDLDLLLRLGAAQVGAGLIDEAENTLNTVMEQRPNSAEVLHFVGRIAFARQDLPTANQFFNRAVDLDASRGEYHLYAAWVALEQGRLGTALDAIGKAIEKDPSLGDAYWLRGRMRIRMGALNDAITDLTRALELKPARVEAYADLGEAFDQLGRRADAVRSYEQALSRESRRGDWWYALGRLQFDSDRAAPAETALERAVAIGDADATPPIWLADAHRILGDAARILGKRASAIEHYRRFLAIAPPGAIDREQIEQALEELQR